MCNLFGVVILGASVTIIEDLTKTPERETSGSKAYNAFDYQTAWGMVRLLELHAAADDYALAFEFHDDIAELNSTTAPTILRFYQVKTSEKATWSLAKIAQRRGTGDVKSSYAGRMFENAVKFGAGVDKVVFVTNQALVDADHGNEEIPFASAKAKKLEKFVTALAEERPSFNSQNHLPLFRFLHCALNTSNFDATLVGAFTIFLEDTIGSGEDARTFYLMMSDECRRKSRRLSALNGLADLLTSKFVTRAGFEAKVESFRKRRERRPNFSSVQPHLHLGWRAEMELEREWRNYEMARHERIHVSMLRFGEEVKNIVEPIINAANTLMEGVIQATSAVGPLVEAQFGPPRMLFVHAVILYEFTR